MLKVKHLIIGAGISGLTYANYVKEDYLIIEKESEVGGYCRTIKKDGYVWDYAGHFFHFNTDEFKKKFIETMPKEDIVFKEKCTKIFYKNSFIDFPFQMNIHQLEKEEFIDCLYDLFNKEEKTNYNNFLDMLYGKFGKSIVEKFLKPYNEKLYAIDLTKLDVDAMGRFFPYADKEAIINNMKREKNSVRSYNSYFLYPVNGAGSFIKVLYDKLDKKKIFLNTSLKSLDINKKIAKLSNGEQIEYDYLISTMPLNMFLKLLGNNNSLLNELSYNKVLVFNLGFDKNTPLCTKEHWLYVPESNINFYRCGFYSNILGTNKLSMYIEIGYSKDENIDDKEIEKQLKLSLKGLKKIGIINESMNLVSYTHVVMDPAYVHINSNTDKKITKLKEELSNNGIYTIGRYGSWIYNSMEDSMIAAMVLAKKLEK